MSSSSADSFSTGFSSCGSSSWNRIDVLALDTRAAARSSAARRGRSRNPRSRRRARGRARPRGSARTGPSGRCPCRAARGRSRAARRCKRPPRVEARRCSRILSSNTMRPTASCCRAARYASVAARNLPYSSFVTLPRAEAHRRARVEQDHEPRVGLADVALDVGALGARVDVPVDEARIVAFGVGAILGELLAEAEERRAMHARSGSR